MKYFTDIDRKTEDSLKKAYRKLSMKLHPDRPNGSNKEFQSMQQEYNFCLENIGNSSASYSSSSSSSSASSSSSHYGSYAQSRKSSYEKEYEDFKNRYGSWKDVFERNEEYFGAGFNNNSNRHSAPKSKPQRNKSPNWDTVTTFTTSISASDYIKFIKGKSKGIRVSKEGSTYDLPHLEESEYQINPTNGDKPFKLKTIHSVDLEINLKDIPKNWMYKDEFTVPIYCSEGEVFGTIKITDKNIKFNLNNTVYFTYTRENIKLRYPTEMIDWIKKIKKITTDFDIKEGMSKSTWFGKMIYNIKKKYKSIMN